jgi:DNA-binding transcriptional MerR regulator
MRIGELGRAAGVDSETIRYYERAGLLLPPARALNGYRAYGVRTLERLAFIRHCRALDVPLAEIKRLLDFVAHPDADCGDINRLIDDQLARTRARLKSMRALEKQLMRRCGYAARQGMSPPSAASCMNWWRPPMGSPAYAMPRRAPDQCHR